MRISVWVLAIQYQKSSELVILKNKVDIFECSATPEKIESNYVQYRIVWKYILPHHHNRPEIENLEFVAFRMPLVLGSGENYSMCFSDSVSKII